MVLDIHVNINDSFLFSRLLVIIDIDIVCVVWFDCTYVAIK